MTIHVDTPGDVDLEDDWGVGDLAARISAGTTDDLSWVLRIVASRMAVQAGTKTTGVREVFADLSHVMESIGAAVHRVCEEHQLATESESAGELVNETLLDLGNAGAGLSQLSDRI